MKDSIVESLKVYLTSTAASVSALYIFNEIIKSESQPTILNQGSLYWKPLSTEEIHNIRLITDDNYGT